MATSTIPTVNSVQPALLFIPDISGFTHFVASNEIEHAQNIIHEVLEVLIESNLLKLEVSEIEGDAVFFYRLGEPPAFSHLLDQVQTMFTRFHHHLQLYEQQRICSCQACTAASNLKLKIIAHFGEVAGFSIQQRQQLFGKDVIIIHRLLKNSLNKHEYALFTHPLVRSMSAPVQLPSWYRAEDAHEIYDIGKIDFTLVDLTELHQQLPAVEQPQYQPLVNTRVVLSTQMRIPASVIQVFNTILNLPDRIKWIDGLKSVEMVNKHQINRIGTRHRCVFNAQKNYIVETEYARVTAQEAELVELNEYKTRGYRYQVKSISDTESNVVMDLLLRNNVLPLVYFNLFERKRQQRSIAYSLDNLSHLFTGTSS